MYEGLRLIELYEEWVWAKSHVDLGSQERAARYDAEIRRRVSAQEIGPPYQYRIRDRVVRFTDHQIRLLFSIPDALRHYPGRHDRWSCHARHAVPVASCHLCREELASALGAAAATLRTKIQEYKT